MICGLRLRLTRTTINHGAFCGGGYGTVSAGEGGGWDVFLYRGDGAAATAAGVAGGSRGVAGARNGVRSCNPAFCVAIWSMFCLFRTIGRGI